MGASAKTLSRFISLHKRGLLNNGASIIELGAQVLYCTGKEKYVRDVIRYFSDNNPEIKKADEYTNAEIRQIANKGMFVKMMNACGFTYKALDIFEDENTIMFDLNIHSPEEGMCEKFDMVTNFGTTEHVINQYLSMKTIHELAKPGGLIYHELPMSGYHYHGYFSYNPLLFHDLADTNSYSIIIQNFSKASSPTPAPRFMTENGYSESHYFDSGIEYIFQKTSSDPFIMPLETATSLSVSKTLWHDVNPYSDLELNFGTGTDPFIGRSLVNVSGWELQRELLLRYRRKLASLFRLS